jgi:hypothetical protein
MMPSRGRFNDFTTSIVAKSQTTFLATRTTPSSLRSSTTSNHHGPHKPTQKPPQLLPPTTLLPILSPPIHHLPHTTGPHVHNALIIYPPILHRTRHSPNPHNPHLTRAPRRACQHDPTSCRVLGLCAHSSRTPTLAHIWSIWRSMSVLGDGGDG